MEMEMEPASERFERNGLGTREERMENNEDDDLDGRREVASACQACRKSRVKCEKLLPCARCQRLNIPCEAQLRGRGRPPTVLSGKGKEKPKGNQASILTKRPSNTDLSRSSSASTGSSQPIADIGMSILSGSSTADDFSTYLQNQLNSNTNGNSIMNRDLLSPQLDGLKNNLSSVGSGNSSSNRPGMSIRTEIPVRKPFFPSSSSGSFLPMMLGSVNSPTSQSSSLPSSPLAFDNLSISFFTNQFLPSNQSAVGNSTSTTPSSASSSPGATSKGNNNGFGKFGSTRGFFGSSIISGTSPIDSVSPTSGSEASRNCSPSLHPLSAAAAAAFAQLTRGEFPQNATGPTTATPPNSNMLGETPTAVKRVAEFARQASFGNNENMNINGYSSMSNSQGISVGHTRHTQIGQAGAKLASLEHHGPDSISHQATETADRTDSKLAGKRPRSRSANNIFVKDSATLSKSKTQKPIKTGNGQHTGDKSISQQQCLKGTSTKRVHCDPCQVIQEKFLELVRKDVLKKDAVPFGRMLSKVSRADESSCLKPMLTSVSACLDISSVDEASSIEDGAAAKRSFPLQDIKKLVDDSSQRFDLPSRWNTPDSAYMEATVLQGRVSFYCNSLWASILLGVAELEKESFPQNLASLFPSADGEIWFRTFATTGFSGLNTGQVSRHFLRMFFKNTSRTVPALVDTHLFISTDGSAARITLRALFIPGASDSSLITRTDVNASIGIPSSYKLSAKPEPIVLSKHEEISNLAYPLLKSRSTEPDIETLLLSANEMEQTGPFSPTVVASTSKASPSSTLWSESEGALKRPRLTSPDPDTQQQQTQRRTFFQLEEPLSNSGIDANESCSGNVKGDSDVQADVAAVQPSPMGTLRSSFTGKEGSFVSVQTDEEGRGMISSLTKSQRLNLCPPPLKSDMHSQPLIS